MTPRFKPFQLLEHWMNGNIWNDSCFERRIKIWNWKWFHQEPPSGLLISYIAIYFVLAHSWTLQSLALFVQKDWQNENEIMEKKMRLINITSLTVICLALRIPLVWQLIYSWWHYKNVFSFVALSVVNLVSFSRQSPLQVADELAASKEVSNAWAAVIARIISSAIWVS